MTVDPSTIFDWVQAFTPQFVEAAQQDRHRVGIQRRVDETLLKVGGRWRSLFRALDEQGQVIDVYVSDRRDASSARACFERTLAAADELPSCVIGDKAKCYPPILRALLPAAEHPCSKYLTTGLEQDHRSSRGGCDRCGASRHQRRQVASVEAMC